MKKFIIYIFLMIFFINIQIKSQWVKCYDQIDKKRVISFAINGNNIFAGTYGWGIYLSTNDGINWTNVGLKGYIVRSVATNGKYVFAGAECDCYEYGIYASTDNGTNWIKTNLMHRVEIFNSLAIVGNNVFAGTDGADSYATYYSTNYGTDWLKVIDLYGEIDAFLLKDDLMFAGGRNGLYVSSDIGLTWKHTLLNEFVQSLIIKGNYIFAGTDHGIFLSVNNGITWKRSFKRPLKKEGKPIYILNDDISFAIRGNNIFAGTDCGVFLSTNNGKKWIEKNEGLPFNDIAILGIAIINNYVIIGTNESCLYRRPLTEFVDE